MNGTPNSVIVEEDSFRFTNFDNWQVIAIENGFTIEQGITNELFGAFNDEGEMVGMFIKSESRGWLDWE
jgi:hypothetical protein